MKNDEYRNTDELMDALAGIRPEYMEEADHILRHGKKGQGKKRLTVLLLAAAVFLAAIGFGAVMIIRNYTRKPVVSTDPSTEPVSTTEAVSEESRTLTEQEYTEEETEQVLSDSDIYNLMPQQISGNSESLCYPQAFQKNGTSRVQLLMIADRRTGISAPVCSKKDCSHDSESCDAFLMNGNGTISALSISESRIYYTMGAGNALGQTVYTKELPAGEPEKAARVDTENLFPEKIMTEKVNSVLVEPQDCFYDGDYYFTACMGNGKSTPDETTYYPTVVRSPITSGREEKTVFQDTLTGFDYIDLNLMPRDEGLYILEYMEKQGETLGKDYNLSDGQAEMYIYLYNPDTDNTELVFSKEYPINFGIGNANILDGKLYFTAQDSTGDRSVYVQDMKGEQEILLKIQPDTETKFSKVSFTEEYFCIWYQDSSSGELMLEIELYSYEGKQVRNFSVKKPLELKPENSESYLREDGSIYGSTVFLGSDSGALYFRDNYYSPSSAGAYEEFVYAVATDGMSVLPFIEKEHVSEDSSVPTGQEHSETGSVDLDGTYVRVISDAPTYDFYDTLTVTGNMADSRRKGDFNTKTLDESGDLVYTYEWEDVVYQRITLHTEETADGKTQSLEVTEYKNDSPQKTLEYQRTDYFEADYTGVYVSVDDPRNDYLMLNEYQELYRHGEIMNVMAQIQNDGLVFLDAYDENGFVPLRLILDPENKPASTLEVTEADGKIYTYELLQNAEETLLPDAFSELLTDQNLYITRNKGKLSGIALEGRYSLNWESILTGASKGQYMEVAVPELSGGIISVYGSDPEKKISLLEDYDVMLYDNHGDRHAYIMTTPKSEYSARYTGWSGFRGWYDEAEYNRLIPSGFISIQNHGQGALEAVREHLEAVKRQLSSVSPGSKYELTFYDAEVHMVNPETGEIIDTPDTDAEKYSLLITVYWATDSERAFRCNIAGASMPYYGDRTDVPENTYVYGQYAVIYLEDGFWELQILGGTL